MRRFWFELETDKPSFGYGAGVTALDEQGARDLLEAAMGRDPVVVSVIADVDVSTPGQGHVIPNMLPPDNRCLVSDGFTAPFDGIGRTKLSTAA